MSRFAPTAAAELNRQRCHTRVRCSSPGDIRLSDGQTNSWTGVFAL